MSLDSSSRPEDRSASHQRRPHASRRYFRESRRSPLRLQRPRRLTGMGKSGLVARKISATFSSTGLPSFFSSSREALHGDLGMLARGDTIIAVSYGGETEEIIRLLEALKRLEIPHHAHRQPEINARRSGRNRTRRQRQRRSLETTFRAESWDPVYTMGHSLSDRYGINLSVESPKWSFPLDTEDVAVADPEYSATHENIHYRVQKRHAIKVRFPLRRRPSHRRPWSRENLAESANKEMPYGYRMDILDGDAFHALVPTTTRNADGRLEAATPLLDHKVTIPLAKRMHSHSTAILLIAELGKQVRIRRRLL